MITIDNKLEDIGKVGLTGDKILLDKEDNVVYKLTQTNKKFLFNQYLSMINFKETDIFKTPIIKESFNKFKFQGNLFDGYKMKYIKQTEFINDENIHDLIKSYFQHCLPYQDKILFNSIDHYFKYLISSVIPKLSKDHSNETLSFWLSILFSYYEEKEYSSFAQPTWYHGDLTTDNILYNNDVYYLIDFNQKLGMWGNMSLDISKILQNFVLGNNQKRIDEKIDQIITGYETKDVYHFKKFIIILIFSHLLRALPYARNYPSKYEKFIDGIDKILFLYNETILKF